MEMSSGRDCAGVAGAEEGDDAPDGADGEAPLLGDALRRE